MDSLRPQRPLRPRQEDPGLLAPRAGPLSQQPPNTPEEPARQLAQDGEVRRAHPPYVPQHHQLRGGVATRRRAQSYAAHGHLSRLRRLARLRARALLSDRGSEHRRGLRHEHHPPEPMDTEHRLAPGRGPEGSHRCPPHRTGRDRVGLPEPGPRRGYPQRRRGAALQDCQVHQLIALRCALHPRRTQHGTPQPGHRTDEA